MSRRGELPRQKRPCAECPWRRDTPPGQFTQARFRALAVTSGTPGAEAGPFAPMFGCHKAVAGRGAACAGWLAAVGQDHLGVRIAVSHGLIPATALAPKPSWPPLFESYAAMAAAQGRRRGTRGCPRATP